MLECAVETDRCVCARPSVNASSCSIVSWLARPPARPPALPSHAAARPNRPCAGKLGSYYTGAYALYHLRVGANDTDKTALDLVLRDVRARMEGSTARASPSGDTRMISLRTPEPLRS